MTRAERDQWNREHRCCGACAHWHIWDDEKPETDLCRGDCDKIEAGTECAISDDGKQIYTYDGYSFEDECYETNYIYRCDKCGHTIEVDDVFPDEKEEKSE